MRQGCGKATNVWRRHETRGPLKEIYEQLLTLHMKTRLKDMPLHLGHVAWWNLGLVPGILGVGGQATLVETEIKIQESLLPGC